MLLLWTESGFVGPGFLGLGSFYRVLCSAWSYFWSVLFELVCLFRVWIGTFGLCTMFLLVDFLLFWWIGLCFLS